MRPSDDTEAGPSDWRPSKRVSGVRSLVARFNR